MTKYMGIDYGLERAGLAISDPDGKMAFPLATLNLRDFRDRKSLLDKLAELALNNKANALVFGMPFHKNGAENDACAIIRNVVKRIKRRIDLPVYYISEYLSSFEAEMDLRECNYKGKKLANALDQQAACRILQSFLDQPPPMRSIL